MDQPLFRKEVFENSHARLEGTVVAATPPSAKIYMYVMAVVVATFVAFLAFASYPTGSDVRGVLDYAEGVSRVYPSSGGEVREIYVAKGQKVAAGAPLMALALVQGPAGLKPEADELSVQQAEVGRQVDLAISMGQSQAAALAAQRAGLVSTIASLREQESLAIQQVRLAQAAVKRTTQLESEGAGTKRQVEDSLSTLVSRRAELSGIRERLGTQRASLAELDATMRRAAIETQRSQSLLQIQESELSGQLAQLQRSDRLVLTAPIAGRVADLVVRTGERALPEKAVVAIVPDNSRLEVSLFLPSRALAFVRAGQDVRLHFDALPYERFGAGHGRVTEISDVPVEPDAGSQAGPGQPLFRVRVKVERFGTKGDENYSRLRAGMGLSARVVLDRQPLWMVLLSPLLKLTPMLKASPA